MFFTYYFLNLSSIYTTYKRMEKLAVVLENWMWKAHLLVKYTIQTHFLKYVEIVNIIRF